MRELDNERFKKLVDQLLELGLTRSKQIMDGQKPDTTALEALVAEIELQVGRYEQETNYSPGAALLRADFTRLIKLALMEYNEA